MKLRDKITANAQPHLQDDEQVQTAFVGQTHSQWLVLAGILPLIILNRYRTVVVTDRRILVCDSGALSTTKANEVLRELPRSTTIGPATGKLWYRSETLGETVRIHKRFWSDIAEADAQA